MQRSTFVAFLLVTFSPVLLLAEVDYQRDIKNVLRERCFACHGALKQESSLRLDTVEAMRKGGDGGAVLEPGDPEASTLLARVTADDESERMPPEGKPLSADQIARLRQWIKSGATAPDTDRPEADPNQHWAFQPPLRAPIPEVVDPDWSRNPIDAFIAAEHQRRKLRPVELADPRLKLRRLHLDLVGLPPTREELDAFAAGEVSYQTAVDQLLESPQYGERWARHWMDIWRYTDWYGLGAQLRNSQKHIWHWRDWIIESLNQDKGYDRMVMEMLAADEISPEDRKAIRATGFLARNYYLFNRTTWLDTTIEHTSKAFLGLTMNCAKCHDHKYDPLLQEDYYRLRAIFEPHQVRLDPVPGVIDLEKDGLPRVFDAHLAAPTFLHIRGDAKNPDRSRPLAPGAPLSLSSGGLEIREVQLPVTAHKPALQDFVLRDHLAKASGQLEAAQAAVAAAESTLAAMKKTAATPTDPDEESKGPLFLLDNFDAAKPDVWEQGPGQWKFVDKVLKQTKTGASRAYLRTKRDHPRDFEATLKFTTIGGDMWMSVGLAFDVVADRDKMIYLSAYRPGSKVQVSFKNGADQSYPVEAKQDRKVALNVEQEMRIAVRGQLVNVSIDGEPAIAYQLPVSREAGRLELVAFDAIADFHQLEVRSLPPTAKLQAAGKPGVSLTVGQAEAKLASSIAALRAAELRPIALRAAHQADLAKYAASASVKKQAELIAEAARAHREYELATAKSQLALAAVNEASADPKKQAEAKKAKPAAMKKVAAAAKALKEPGQTYPSLRASRKALEGPAEKADSRNQPYPTSSSGRRTALAKWIVDRQNPLASRVAINHLWTRHFGHPLVESVADFGRRAEPPRLQELLDWLAVELMENGWRMKHIHRLIVTSRTYQLSTSTARAEAHTQSIDPKNNYLWRRLPGRMESQVIRDSLLHMAGELDDRVGGPTINPNGAQEPRRRSLYFTQSRDHRDKFVSMFDDADIHACYRRTESIVPQQALTMANSKLALSMARKFADRLSETLGDADDARFLRAAYLTILAVEPSKQELAACQEALQATRLALEGAKHKDSRRRARQNIVHALFNHNDFITVH